MWRMTLKNNRGPLLCYFKLCASFHSHLWIQIGVIVRKTQIGAKFALTSVILTFDLWPWTFAWTSLLSMVMTPKNFVMIRWQEHSEKVWRMDGRTNGRTDGKNCSQSCLVAAKHLEICILQLVSRAWHDLTLRFSTPSFSTIPSSSKDTSFTEGDFCRHFSRSLVAACTWDTSRSTVFWAWRNRLFKIS